VPEERRDERRAVLRDVRAVIHAVRFAVERRYQSFGRKQDLDAQETIRQVLLALETARLSLGTAMSATGSLEHVDSYGQTLLRLLGDLRAVMLHPHFERVAAASPFRISPNTITNERSKFLETLREKNLAEAMAHTIDRLSIEIEVEEGSMAEPDIAASYLRQILPAQKIAPLQFQVHEERLVLLQQLAGYDRRDHANIEAARKDLQKAGAKILDELSNSNCDKRLIESVEQLQAELADGPNIIALGLSNLRCEMMAAAFEEELPDAVFAMLGAHSRSVDLFASQFPEWNRFIENATAVHIVADDIEILDKATRNLISELESKPELSEPEVPKSLLKLAELVSNPRTASKRATFAILRSLENLFSRVFMYAADFLDSTVHKTIESVSSTVAKSAAVALVSLALNSAFLVSPVAGKVLEMQWLRNAIEIVQRQIHRMKTE
jgi:hypothetical protein